MPNQITEELRTSGVAQVIVFLKSAPTTTGAMAAAIKSHFVSSERSQASALARTGKRKGSTPAPMTYYPNLGVALGTVNHDGLMALRADKSRVAKINGAPVLSLIRPQRIAAATLTTKLTWGIKRLGIPELWDEGLTGKGVIVGHLDTGADGKHPALKNAFAAFAEFDVLGQQVNPVPKPHDTDDHGTHTAATIAGRAVSGRSVGLAPGAKLASAIVIEGGNVIARVLGGMDWAIGQGVKVLNMSLGLRGVHDDFLGVTQILRARGILPVFAVGSEGPGTSRSPGNYVEALSVGAMDDQDAVADFSSSQRFMRKKDPIVPDLVAPGVDVISARPGGGYQMMDGSSMATPHIAGLAALLFEAKPDATVDAVERAIFTSCQPLPGELEERENRGLPNARRALATLQK